MEERPVVGTQPPALLTPRNPQALEELMAYLRVESPLDIPKALSSKLNSRDLAHAVLGRYDLIRNPERRRLAEMVVRTQISTPSLMTPVASTIDIDPVLSAPALTSTTPTTLEGQQEENEGWIKAGIKSLYASITSLGKLVLSTGEWLAGRAVDFGLRTALRTLGGETFANYLMNTPLEDIDRERIKHPRGSDMRRALDFLYYARSIAEADPINDTLDFWQERRKGQILNDMAQGGYFASRLLEGTIGAGVSLVGVGVEGFSGALGHLVAGDLEGAGRRLQENLIDWTNLHMSLFHKDGSEMDFGTYLLKLGDVVAGGAPVSFDRVSVVWRDAKGRIYSDEIPLIEFERFKEKLAEQGAKVFRSGNTYYKTGEDPRAISYAENDVLKGLASIQLGNRTVNPIYTFGVVSELFAPFPVRFIGSGARIARGTSSFAKEAGDLLHIIKHSPSLYHKTEAVLDLFMLPSGVAMNLPFGLTSRLFGRVGTPRLAEKLMTAGAQEALGRVGKVAEKISASLFGQHYIPYEYGVYGYNASLHRAWDNALKELKDLKGLDDLKAGAKDYEHFMSALPEEVFARMQQGDYHRLVSHILQREGIRAVESVEDLISARTRLAGKYGGRVSPIAATLHTAETYFGLGKSLARANLKVGEYAQRLANTKVGRWVYPAVSFVDPYMRGSLNFAVGASTLLQGQLQQLERTFAEMFQGIMGMDTFEKSQLYALHQKVSAVKREIAEKYGRGTTETGSAVFSTDIGKLLHEMEDFITDTGIFPDTKAYRYLTNRNKNGNLGIDEVVNAYEVAKAKTAEEIAEKKVSAKQANEMFLHNFRSELKQRGAPLLEEEIQSIYEHFKNVGSDGRIMLRELMTGITQSPEIQKYALLTRELRKYGMTPEYLDELVEHYKTVKGSPALSKEQLRTVQGLYLSLLNNRLLTPEQLAGAEEFLRKIGLSNEQITPLLTQFQKARLPLQNAVLETLRYTNADAFALINRMRRAREQYAEGFRISIGKYFPDCEGGI